MITEWPTKLLVLLAVLTLSGIVIGYCIALLRAKHSARKAIELVRLELTQERRAVESDLQMAKNAIQKQRLSGSDDSSLSQPTGKHSDSQAAYIESLETQVAVLEDKQLRLQRDFASYKSTKTRQLELARSASPTLADSYDLPTLSRKVEPVAGSMRARRADLTLPLTSDLDIPSLAESELPDSVDALEFDLADSASAETTSRG